MNLLLRKSPSPYACLTWSFGRGRAGAYTAAIVAATQRRNGHAGGVRSYARFLRDRLVGSPSLAACGNARGDMVVMAVLAIRQWPDHQALDAGTRRRFPSARPAGPGRFKRAWPRCGAGRPKTMPRAATGPADPQGGPSPCPRSRHGTACPPSPPSPRRPRVPGKSRAQEPAGRPQLADSGRHVQARRAPPAR